MPHESHRQSAWERACADFHRVFHSAWFYGWATLCEAAGIGVGIWVSQNHSTWAQVVLTVTAFGVSAFIAIGSTFMALLLSAPTRQRDEAWTALESVTQPPAVRLPYEEAISLATRRASEGIALREALRVAEGPGAISDTFGRCVAWDDETWRDLRSYTDQWAETFGLGDFEDVLPTKRDRITEVLDAKLVRLHTLMGRPYFPGSDASDDIRDNLVGYMKQLRSLRQRVLGSWPDGTGRNELLAEYQAIVESAGSWIANTFGPNEAALFADDESGAPRSYGRDRLVHETDIGDKSGQRRQVLVRIDGSMSNLRELLREIRRSEALA